MRLDKRDRVRLEHMLEASKKAIGFASSRTRADLCGDAAWAGGFGQPAMDKEVVKEGSSTYAYVVYGHHLGSDPTSPGITDGMLAKVKLYVPPPRGSIVLVR